MGAARASESSPRRTLGRMQRDWGAERAAGEQAGVRIGPGPGRGQWRDPALPVLRPRGAMPTLRDQSSMNRQGSVVLPGVSLAFTFVLSSRPPQHVCLEGGCGAAALGALGTERALGPRPRLCPLLGPWSSRTAPSEGRGWAQSSPRPRAHCALGWTAGVRGGGGTGELRPHAGRHLCTVPPMRPASPCRLCPLCLPSCVCVSVPLPPPPCLPHPRLLPR